MRVSLFRCRQGRSKLAGAALSSYARTQSRDFFNELGMNSGAHRHWIAARGWIFASEGLLRVPTRRLFTASIRFEVRRKRSRLVDRHDEGRFVNHSQMVALLGVRVMIQMSSAFGNGRGGGRSNPNCIGLKFCRRGKMFEQWVNQCDAHTTRWCSSLLIAIHTPSFMTSRRLVFVECETNARRIRMVMVRLA